MSKRKKVDVSNDSDRSYKQKMRKTGSGSRGSSPSFYTIPSDRVQAQLDRQYREVLGEDYKPSGGPAPKVSGKRVRFVEGVVTPYKKSRGFDVPSKWKSLVKPLHIKKTVEIARLYNMLKRYGIDKLDLKNYQKAQEAFLKKISVRDRPYFKYFMNNVTVSDWDKFAKNAPTAQDRFMRNQVLKLFKKQQSEADKRKVEERKEYERKQYDEEMRHAAKEREKAKVIRDQALRRKFGRTYRENDDSDDLGTRRMKVAYKKVEESRIKRERLKDKRRRTTKSNTSSYVPSPISTNRSYDKSNSSIDTPVFGGKDSSTSFRYSPKDITMVDSPKPLPKAVPSPKFSDESSFRSNGSKRSSKFTPSPLRLPSFWKSPPVGSKRKRTSEPDSDKRPKQRSRGGSFGEQPSFSSFSSPSVYPSTPSPPMRSPPRARPSPGRPRAEATGPTATATAATPGPPPTDNGLGGNVRSTPQFARMWRNMRSAARRRYRRRAFPRNVNEAVNKENDRDASMFALGRDIREGTRLFQGITARYLRARQQSWRQQERHASYVDQKFKSYFNRR